MASWYSELSHICQRLWVTQRINGCSRDQALEALEIEKLPDHHQDEPGSLFPRSAHPNIPILQFRSNVFYSLDHTDSCLSCRRYHHENDVTRQVGKLLCGWCTSHQTKLIAQRMRIDNLKEAHFFAQRVFRCLRSELEESLQYLFGSEWLGLASDQSESEWEIGKIQAVRFRKYLCYGHSVK
jgi:hypothetical protein